MFHKESLNQSNPGIPTDILPILAECHSQCKIVVLNSSWLPAYHKNYDPRSSYLPQGTHSAKDFEDACKYASCAIGQIRCNPDGSHPPPIGGHCFDAALLIPIIKDNPRVKSFVVEYQKKFSKSNNISDDADQFHRRYGK